MKYALHKNVAPGQVKTVIPGRFHDLLEAMNLPNDKVDIIVFNGDRPIFRSNVEKALATVETDHKRVLLVGKSFTEEAGVALKEASVLVCTFSVSFWTEERWLRQQGSR